MKCAPHTTNTVQDPAFLDRVDIKQLIPSPSPAAIYNIFRSCLNELVRSSLVDAAAVQVPATPSSASSSPHKPITRLSKAKSKHSIAKTSVPTEPWTVVTTPTIPSFSEMQLKFANHASSPACRVWDLALKCQGFSGRTLRRLPILGLAMYTWGGNCSLQDAVSALEAAIDQELMVVKIKDDDVRVTGV